MNTIQTMPNSGFRIVWFMLLEATASLIIITAAITLGAFFAIIIVISALAFVIKVLSSATPPNITNVNEYSFAPYTVILDGWKSLMSPGYLAMSDVIDKISLVRKQSRLYVPDIKKSKPTISTLLPS